MSNSKKAHLEIGVASMKSEALAIMGASERLNSSFEEAVEVILRNKGKLVFCGIGKSGHIAKKISRTFISGGINASFLHASEAFHGDLGIYQPNDVTILFSKSGSTKEILDLMPVFRKFNSTIIAVLGRVDSPIGNLADIILDASVERESDHLDLIPTSSSSVSIAMGHALSVAVLSSMGLTSEQFANFHPGGQLGKNLSLNVGNVMQPLDKVACAAKDSTLREIVFLMTKFPLGVACVLDSNKLLQGIVTDGDIRRYLNTEGSNLDTPIEVFMTKNPKYISSKCSLKEALSIMENRPSQISVIPVLGNDNKLEGLIRLHDILQANLS